MIRIALAAATFLFATSATAQDIARVPWAEQQPTAGDYRDTYPTRALAAGVEGRATLLCTITPERKLDCTIETETPTGYGFGPAAPRLSRHYVVLPVEQEPRAVIGSLVRVPVLYTFPD